MVSLNNKQVKKSILFILLLSIHTVSNVLAQGDDYFNQKFLQEEVENPNPDYMPHIGFGYGILGFYGDVRNANATFLSGKPCGKVNINFFLDQEHHTRANVYVLALGQIEGNTVSYLKPEENINFLTDLTAIGLNVHYDFDHFVAKKSFVRPFVSLGTEFLMFSSKTDRFRIDNTSGTDIRVNYNYWSDGSIRDVPESANKLGNYINRDYIYETDIKNSNAFNGGDYTQRSLAIPLDFGLEFKITERTRMRVGTSYHYSFTDFIDGISQNTTPKGNSGYDAFTYTYATLHFDLFSDDETVLMNKLFAEMTDFDMIMADDEDGDGALDAFDKCLRTPAGTEVDTVGCPFDDDFDGIPNYMDKQKSMEGAIVDRDGVEIQDEKVWENLNLEGLARGEVPMFLEMMNKLGAGGNRRLGQVEIPEKFKTVDADNDGYISFDEVLKTIDSFFDFEVEYTTEDIYELNDLFFAQ